MRSHWSWFAALVGVRVLLAAPPDTLWTRTYGGGALDQGSALRVCSDGGYIIAGSSASYGAGDTCAYLVRTDANGDTVWTRTYGGPGYAYFSSVHPTLDGGFVAAGCKEPAGSGSEDVYVVKVDERGNALWTRTYGGSANEWALWVIQTQDSGYVVSGVTESFGAGLWDIYVLRLAANGDAVWTGAFGWVDLDVGFCVAIVPGGFVVSGVTYSSGSGQGDAILLKVDDDGRLVWAKIYGDDGYEWAGPVLVTADSGFVIVGLKETGKAGSKVRRSLGAFDRAGKLGPRGPLSRTNAWLLRLGPSGDSVWAKVYGDSSEVAYSVAQVHSGGYIMAGTSGDRTAEADVWLARTNPAGGTLWTLTCGDAGCEEAYSVQVVPGGGYAIAGYNTSHGWDSSDVYLVRVASDGAVEECTWQDAACLTPNATVLNSALHLQVAGRQNTEHTAELLDAAGRKVLDLRPGANDVSKLSPGVYFVRAVSRELSAASCHKVIVTR